MKNMFSDSLHSVVDELFSSKFGMTIDMTELYSYTPV